jgi:hypothetical protein
MEMKPVERWRSNLASGLSGGLTEIMESVVGGLAREELIRGCVDTCIYAGCFVGGKRSWFLLFNNAFEHASD